jgi:hypothetical protein
MNAVGREAKLHGGLGSLTEQLLGLTHECAHGERA